MARAKQETPKETKLDSDVSTPSTTAPGDGPADTTDPTERAVSIPVRPGPEAIKVGTVNAVVPVEPVTPPTPTGDDVVIEQVATGPAGEHVRVRQNVTTGETELA